MRLTALTRVVVAAGITAIGLSFSAPAGAATGAVPFTDPQADGYIGLCDLAGHNITSGSLDSTPFTWKVVASVSPPKPFTGRGENADLEIYQARQGVAPGDWTGEDLMGATNYKHPRQPAAEATYKDDSLKQITLAIPPRWDGLYVLRMQFGKTGYGIYGATYPMTVIQVSGQTWHVVSGGLVNCAKAKAVPQETLTGVATQLPPKPIAGLNPPTAAPSARASATAVPTALPRPAVASNGPSTGLTKTVAQPITAPVTLASSHHHGGISATLIGLLVAIGLVAAGIGGLALGRRSRPPVT